MPCAQHPDGLLPADARAAASREGCSAVPRPPGRECREAAVCEAVFRYQLQQPLVDHPQVARLSWVHGAAVDVVGGYYLTHRHAAGLRYHVEHQGHAWAVTTVHLLWRV